ncbi:hypothetical protein KOW79_009408 [Hemibagrus wyckioides]|uniref:Uncharacterized protein n=1 Tax=Hemibagrus wyckioides TaxID=337641 RepID=A0A9D3SKX0_9TELE|nr:hypothetical protein KOW79_009408 [Hemibagrus wyckioides]
MNIRARVCRDVPFFMVDFLISVLPVSPNEFSDAASDGSVCGQEYVLSLILQGLRDYTYQTDTMTLRVITRSIN